VTDAAGVYWFENTIWRSAETITMLRKPTVCRSEYTGVFVDEKSNHARAVQAQELLACGVFSTGESSSMHVTTKSAHKFV
jgi:hypothetical protein